MGAVVAGAALFAVGLSAKSSPSHSSATAAAGTELIPSRLNTISLSQSLAQVAAWAGMNAGSDTRLDLRLKGTRFESVAFFWPEPGAVDITRVTLNAREPIAKGDPVLKTASAVFGARFVEHPQGGYIYESNGVEFSVKDRNVEIRVSPEENPNWRRQLVVLWQVARALVLQEPVAIDAATRRDLLGTGYLLGALAQIDPTVDIDQSRAHLTRLFPGVSGGVAASGLTYQLPLDHPWFKDAELIWKNEKGGKLANARFNPPPFVEQFANQIEIRDCLTRRFGPAKDAEIDHLANKHSYQFQKYWPHASVYVGSTYIWLEFEDASRAYPVNFKAVVEALTACKP